MTLNYRTHDDSCDIPEYDYHHFIDGLIKDIQKLELRIIYLRYLLSGHLPDHEGKMLKCEMFSDLAGGYCAEAVYQRYISYYCDGIDPMECPDFHEHMIKISRGEELFDL